MRIYISGASAEIDLIEGWRDRLHLQGAEVLDGWMHAVRHIQANGCTDADLTDVERQRHAHDDLFDVAKCDVFWLIVPPKGRSIGAWIELGFALGLAGTNQHARRIVASGDLNQTLFLRHRDVTAFDSHEAAFRSIVDGP